ncbi:MAG: type II toxin-antitoxin system RelE/ParE family toxin [Oscillospiraceae bacterium]|nr:type II toxin-antitoxin system RelE/ParE family toxin [Oscillospiraceae bacterium]
MEQFRIIIADLAKQDIRDIRVHIANELQEPVVADEIVNEILDATLTLEEMPERIALVKDARLAEKGIRPLYVKNYTVFFRIEKSKKIVDIVRVMYSKRDWASLL